MNLSRDYFADIEIRSDGTGRTVHGIVVPYGVVANVSDGGAAYRESFAPGAFARDIAARAGDYAGVKLLYQHDSHEPIGRAMVLREDAAGLYGEFRISDTGRGNEALQLLHDRVIDSFSVGFRPVAHETRAGVVVRTKASLRETSLVTFPAYSGALVGGVRTAAEDDELAAELRAMAAVLGNVGDTDDLVTLARRLREHVEAGAQDPTADGRPDLAGTTDPDSAPATPLGIPSHRHLRVLAREKGFL